MTPIEVETRLRSYLNDLTSTTPLARPDLPRDSYATADQLEAEPTKASRTVEGGVLGKPVGAQLERSGAAPSLATAHRRGRFLVAMAAATVLVVGLALAIIYGPRSSDIRSLRPEKTATVPPPTSATAAANEIIPIDTTTDRPGVPISLDFTPNFMWAPPEGPMLYAVDLSSGVVPIDATTAQVLPAIPVGMEPSAFAMTPNGKTLFVLDQGYDTAGAQGGDVIPIDTATDEPGPPILPNTAPTVMVMTPNGKTLYVADDGSVYPINVATDQAGPPISIVGAPYGYAIAVTPNGKTVYVQSINGTVTPIDTATNVPGSPISVGPAGPMGTGIVITPNGRTAYVLETNDVGIPQDDFGVLVPIDTSTNTAETAIQVSPYGVHEALAPNGRTLYLAPSSATTNEVTAIDTQTNKVEKVVRLPGTAGPDAMAFTPNSQTLYVAGDIRGTVTPIAVATNKVGPGIAAGTDLGDLVITPNGKTLLALNVGYTPPPPTMPSRPYPGAP
jgi:DNA-binding beta-propeller fold protein YncE